MSCRCSNCCPFQQANLEKVTELDLTEAGTCSRCGSRGYATQRGAEESHLRGVAGNPVPAISLPRHSMAIPTILERGLLLEATFCYQHLLREHVVIESPKSRPRTSSSIPNPDSNPDPEVLPSSISRGARYPEGFCADGAPCPK